MVNGEQNAKPGMLQSQRKLLAKYPKMGNKIPISVLCEPAC
jgi:hypothetical protein